MNTFGKIFTVTTYGESHGAAVGGVVDGMPAGIDIASMTSTTVSTTYYNLQGQRIKQPQRGAYIIVEHKTDGTRVSRKVVNL